jgi:hypothetical protein
MQFPVLSRIKNAFWALGIVSALLIAGMGYAVRSNPDHVTSQYPESMRLNGIVRFMTAAQKHSIEAALAAFFLCALGGVAVGKYIIDRSN